MVKKAPKEGRARAKNLKKGTQQSQEAAKAMAETIGSGQSMFAQLQDGNDQLQRKMLIALSAMSLDASMPLQTIFNDGKTR